MVIGPDDAAHRWTEARHKFTADCARIRESSQRLVQRLVSFKVYALSVLSFVGSVAEPYKETIAVDDLALQRLSAGPFHGLPSAMLLRGCISALNLMLMVSS